MEKITTGRKYFTGRHFEDESDLSDGLDTHLKPIEDQSEETIRQVVSEIIENTQEKGFTKVLLVSSDRNRAIETSQIIKEQIQSSSEIRARVIPDSRLAELDHGSPILPEGYTSSTRLVFLKDAWSAFWEETFDEYGEYRNLDYHFGDPLLSDGVFFHPELKGHFQIYGESYKELCIRYYDAVLSFLKTENRFDDSGFNVALIAHSATVAIIKKMFEVALNGEIFAPDYKVGELMKICWKRYQQELKKEVPPPEFGSYEIISLEKVNIEGTISVLEREVEYLKK